MKKDEIYQLMSRNLSGDITPEELISLQEQLKNEPKLQLFYATIESYWQQKLPTENIDNITSTAHFDKIISQAEENIFKQKSSVRKLVINLSIAASVISIVAFGSRMYYNTSAKKVSTDKLQEITTAKGSRTKIILPDSSTVWINSDSKLIFPEKFSDTLRSITLVGEAYFDIKKNAAKPFVVHTADIDIKVLGTAFNVKAYLDDKDFEATLIHGSIELSEHNNLHNSKIIMKPNEKLSFSKPAFQKSTIATNTVAGKTAALTSSYTIKEISTTAENFALPEIAWVNNTLIIDNEPLVDASKKLERWFNVSIQINDSIIGQQPVRAIFKDESLDNVMKALQTIINFKYTIIKNQIIIDKR